MSEFPIMALFGIISVFCNFVPCFFVFGSKYEMSVILFPINSIRIGHFRFFGKTSTMPPRFAKNPCWTAESVNSKPLSLKNCRSSLRLISFPCLILKIFFSKIFGGATFSLRISFESR
ncbi:MAG: hypothetical protein ACD_63C00211G0006 [uncultured bacterium]|nr:MAG: hypothetical protein ACD_63C00211G0006 [uncultured bacterium]